MKIVKHALRVSICVALASMFLAVIGCDGLSFGVWTATKVTGLSPSQGVLTGLEIDYRLETGMFEMGFDNMFQFLSDDGSATESIPDSYTMLFFREISTGS